MWTRRKTFSTTDLAYLNHGTPVHACTCTTSTATTTTNVAHASSCATCLEYCLIPCMDQREAREVLRVVLHRWMTDAEESDLASLAKDPAMLKAFSQLEYFFVGTEGGALLMLPLIPPHFLRLLEQRHPHVQRCREEAESEVAHNQGSPVLLHQHAPHGPVMEVAVHESVVASVAADGCVVVSLFHPHLLPLVAIHHAHPLRCVRLWEGDEAFGAGALHRSASTRLTDEQRRWSAEALQEEEAAIYLITGDQCAVVRLWRVDVIRREHTLQHIFVMVPHLQHQHSSLDVLHREDATPHVARREANMAIHCLAISGNAHLVCGVDEGVYVFSLNRLAWKVKTATTRDDEVCCGHPLGWDEARHAPMTACFAAATTTSEDEEYEAGLRCLRLRALRLVNRHVWVRDTAFVLPMLEQRQHEAGRSSSSVGSPRPPSTWKPKYARTITSGQAIGVVCNEVRLPLSSRTSMEVLLHTVVDVGFEDGELHNDVRLPLACVEPVVYPLQHLPTPGSACVALAVLEAGRRVVGAGSDGRLQLFEWPADGAEEMHPLLVVGGEPAAHRGLGRQLCVLHAPDIFLTCDINEGIVKEWHLHHDTPEVVLRCARQFALKPTAPSSSLGVDVLLPPHKDSVEVASGVSCMTAYAPAAALFLVAACETTIQSYSLAMLMGCELPPDYIFNGHKTVRLPASLMAAVEAEQV